MDTAGRVERFNRKYGKEDGRGGQLRPTDLRLAAG